MEIIRLFCIVGKTGTGKSTYLNKILEDKEFLEAHNLSNLVYGTTRKKRNGEIDGVDFDGGKKNAVEVSINDNNQVSIEVEVIIDYGKNVSQLVNDVQSEVVNAIKGKIYVNSL